MSHIIIIIITVSTNDITMPVRLKTEKEAHKTFERIRNIELKTTRKRGILNSIYLIKLIKVIKSVTHAYTDEAYPCLTITLN